MSIIKVQNLKKTFKISKRPKGLPGTIANLFIPKYKEKVAVDGISFEIQKGEAVGFIGANGAGKSTTIKMISGILYPTEGSIEVLGFNPQKNRRQYVANIGVVFGQKSQLSLDLPVIDTFELLRQIYKIPRPVYEENLKTFTELLDMESFIEQPVRQLSLGQRMRADIAAALLHSPQLVFFDEPTIGLDLVAKERIRQFLRYINKEKKVTMIFTTHDMKDIEATCDRMILIDKGKLLYDGSVEGISSKYAKERNLIVKFSSDVNVEAIDKVKIVKEEDNKVSFLFNSEEISIKELIKILSEKYEIEDFTVKEMEIETVVRKIYEGDIQL